MSKDNREELKCCGNCECTRIKDLYEDDCFVKEAQTWLEDKE